jgi:hypothetical protein
MTVSTLVVDDEPDAVDFANDGGGVGNPGELLVLAETED